MSRRKSLLNAANSGNLNVLSNDSLFVNPRKVSVKELTGIQGLGRSSHHIIITDPADKADKIINTVSGDYGLLPNEVFIPAIENRLNAAEIKFQRRVISRENARFAVDYILADDNYHINVKNNRDIIKPMFRVVNSYDGSSNTEGHFGFFRQVCSNGLHVAKTQMEFAVRHRGAIVEIVMPKIEDLIVAFMSNEFYSLHEKFKVLSESPIEDLNGFVKYTLGETGLFKYSKSEKNPDAPSVGAQFILNTINKESVAIGTKPNLWLGYNAFNEYIHTQNEKVFMLQERADRKIFDTILAQVN